MRIITEPKLDFDDVLIVPKRSTLTSRKEVDLARTFVMPHSQRVFACIPIVASNMDTVGTVWCAHKLAEMNCLTTVHKYLTKEDYLELSSKSPTRKHAFVPVALGDDWITIDQRLSWAGQSKDDALVYIDVANGYQEKFVEYIQSVRKQYPDIILMAGNVVTTEQTEELVLAGVDIVKIGIGPGAQCETRKVTGVGYPQLSAIIECADAAHGLKGFVCADGGCKTSGDVAKAFAAGADFVMLGTMLAGHKENISDEESKNLQKYKEEMEQSWPKEIINLDDPQALPVKTYGMSSTTAMEKHHGGVAPYRSSEGKTSTIEYRGTIENTINQILGGLRSTCTYVGASKLKELSKRTTFVVKK